MATVRSKAYPILDGTVLPIDRIAADRSYYSGKKKLHGMHVQVLTDAFGMSAKRGDQPSDDLAALEPADSVGDLLEPDLGDA